MAYSDILEQLTYLDSFRHYSRAIHAYSEPYLSRFRHIYNSGSFRVVLFHAYSRIFIKLHILRHIFPHWDSYIFRILASQVLLLNHCSDLFGTFFYFCLKSKYSTSFSPGQYFSNNNSNNPRQHVTHANMPPALGRIAFHFSNSNKKHFYRNLTPSNTGQIKLVNFEKRLAKIRRKIVKTRCISVYADVLMMYINLPVHGHIQEFTKETAFCNCY